MYNAEFLDAMGGVLERIVLGMLPDAMTADLQAKALFANVQIRYPSVVGYRVLNNDGREVARMRATHA
jgi:hypothetical protein